MELVGTGLIAFPLGLAKPLLKNQKIPYFRFLTFNFFIQRYIRSKKRLKRIDNKVFNSSSSILADVGIVGNVGVVVVSADLL